MNRTKFTKMWLFVAAFSICALIITVKAQSPTPTPRKMNGITNVVQSEVPSPSPTPTPNSCPLCGTQQKQFAYNLSVERVGSGDIIEFTPMNIKWTLTVKEFGISGPDPTPVDIRICPVIFSPDFQSQCAQISNASPGRIYKGRLTVSAPPAGKQSPLRMVVLASQTREVPDIPVGEAAVKLDVAARYDVSMASFNLLTTRSTKTDTVWLSLQGLVKSTPLHASDNEEACKLVGFNWCVINQYFGNVEDSGVKIVNNLRVGPYDLVPEREQDLRFLFYLDNHGTNISQEIGLAVANGFSKAGMVILGAYGAAGGGIGTGNFPTELDKIMEDLHSAEFASCDGKLAADMVVIANTTIANQPQNTLDAFTKGNGTFSTAVLNNGVPKIYHETDGDFRCDRRGGKYTVTYTVHRTSWRVWGFQPRW